MATSGCEGNTKAGFCLPEDTPLSNLDAGSILMMHSNIVNFELSPPAKNGAIPSCKHQFSFGTVRESKFQNFHAVDTAL